MVSIKDRKILRQMFSHYDYVMTTAQLSKEKLYYRDIQRMLKAGLIEKVKRGYYHWTMGSGKGDVVIISRLFPDGILCMETALFYYGYSDRNPAEWNIAIDKNASRQRTRIDYPSIKAYRLEPALLSIGVTRGEINFTDVRIYDRDRTICDVLRNMNKMDKEMQGEVIHISATSENHINAMDMNSDYGDGANPVILKSEFILSLCEQLIGGSSLGAKQKSIIDRCTASVYRYYQQGNYMGTPPTLQDFREELLKQDEPEAQEIALAIELFTDGSLNTFAKHTNVDTHSRLICYDILDLGKQLQPIGMLVVLDSILNRITQNRAKGRNTFIFIDEIYLLFQHEYSANFLFTLWKRVRKYGAYCTGITQNVDDLLQSHTARTMLANSEFIIMLNQASTDRIELAKLLNISDLQLSYITNVGAGQGLLKVGSSLVPFVNKFPRNTELYKLMTTKFGEV